MFSGRPSQIGSAIASRPDSKVELPSANADNKIATTISPAASVLPPAVDLYRTDGALGE